MELKNQVQLITYPDSLGGDLNSLQIILNTYFPDVFKGGIHILPPFPSSGDRGFAPVTYLEIDPKHGSWENIRSLSEQYDIMLDLMVNHISAKSVWFQDFLSKGRNSEFKDLFITLEKLWKDGNPVEEDISAMFLRRQRPYSTFNTGNEGRTETVWTTFGKEEPSQQIDLDINSLQVRELLSTFLENFSRQNVRFVRLDAVGYVIKKMGSSCFFVEPDIYEFLDWVAKKAEKLSITLLPEVHSHYSIQYKLSEKGFWIYDFILPYAVLHTLINKSTSFLLSYLANRPVKQFTMLDCHDGVPVKPDLDTLVKTHDARKLVDVCLSRGANLSYVYSEKHKDADGFDVHQIRGTYYSLLNADDNAYIAARAIQFFIPGIPQVYYNGFLAGENDQESISATGDGREINRHNFTIAEIEETIKKTVVQRLIRLIMLRNEHPAFNGTFSFQNSTEQTLIFEWNKGDSFCKAIIDITNNETTITFNNPNSGIQEFIA